MAAATSHSDLGERKYGVRTATAGHSYTTHPMDTNTPLGSLAVQGDWVSVDGWGRGEADIHKNCSAGMTLEGVWSSERKFDVALDSVSVDTRGHIQRKLTQRTLVLAACYCFGDGRLVPTDQQVDGNLD